MRYSFWQLAIFMLVIAPVAQADSFQVIEKSSTTVHISAGDDNYMGIYSPGDHSVTSWAPYSGTQPFTNLSFTTPEGTYINSASLVLRIKTSATGPATASFSDGRSPIPPPNTSNPVGTPATIEGATAFGSVEGLGSGYLSCCNDGVEDGIFTDFDLSFYLLSHGNEISTRSLEDLFLSVDGGVTAIFGTAGYNFRSYVAGDGSITLPYTVELSGTYSTSPVPEPSTMALLGTGLVGLSGIVRRRLAG